MLADVVAKGGNLLLNIGPGPDGSWDDAAYDRLAALGAWMKVNSEAIYATRPVAPYVDGKWRYEIDEWHRVCDLSSGCW